MPSREVAFITQGDRSSLTGGYLYNRHVVGALRQAGYTVTESAPTAIPPHAALCIVDSICFAAFTSPPQPAVIALVHALRGDLSGDPRQGQADERMLHAAEVTIAMSPPAADELRVRGARNSIVIPPGRDGARYPGITAQPHLGRILCVANWFPVKGIHVLVEAVTALPSVQLDLVGAHPDATYARRIADHIAGSGMKDRVQIHGPLRGEALARRFSTAGSFVLPSRHETFGIAAAEALDWGIPVVASALPALRWLCGDACILVPPDSPASLNAALECLHHEPSLRSSLAGRARLRAQALPCWADTESHWQTLVSEIIGPATC